MLKINRNFSLAFTWDPIMPQQKNALTIIEAYEQSLQCLLKSITETTLVRGGRGRYFIKHKTSNYDLGLWKKSSHPLCLLLFVCNLRTLPKTFFINSFNFISWNNLSLQFFWILNFIRKFYVINPNYLIHEFKHNSKQEFAIFSSPKAVGRFLQHTMLFYRF